MEDVRQLVQEEGREARNLVAFHVAMESPSRIARKPPRCNTTAHHAPSRPSRLRSASTGRDKRSELRARYWALLFGDLQRAVGEIYNTVESHENINECQEVILVLENYTRDFKALGEWFRLKWEYDNTPPLQRPQSLAWEIRKTDFVKPELKKSYPKKTSPSVSGKNSPCLSGNNTPSGKSSPSLTGKSSPGSGKISPRISVHVSSPKANVEFFSSKINLSKVTDKPEPIVLKDVPRLSRIKEKDVKECLSQEDVKDESDDINTKRSNFEISATNKKENMSNGDQQTTIKKNTRQTESQNDLILTSSLQSTVDLLTKMEDEFLEKHFIESEVKNDKLKTQMEEVPDENIKANKSDVSDNTKEPLPHKTDLLSDTLEVHTNIFFTTTENKCDENELQTKALKHSLGLDIEDKNSTENHNVSNNIKKSNITLKLDENKKIEAKTNEKPTKAPYSQAAAKPKSSVSKPDIKSSTSTKLTTSIVRSKTVIEVKPNITQKVQKQFPKRSQANKCSYPFNLTTGRTTLFESTSKANGPKKPVNKSIHPVAGSTKINTDKNDMKPPMRPKTLKLNEKSRRSLEKIDQSIHSSSETIIDKSTYPLVESTESIKTLVPENLEITEDVSQSLEVLGVANNKGDDDGWLTVKSRRLMRELKSQSKSYWANRFNQPSATTSLPTLNMIISPKQETKTFEDPLQNCVDARAKSEQPRNLKYEKSVKIHNKSKTESKSKHGNTAILRQKSDVTGLKTRSSRNKVLTKKSEKHKDRLKNGSDLKNNRLHSSLESLITAPGSKENEDIFDFDKWKADFKSRFGYLDDDDQIPDQNEILKTADPSEMSEIAEMTEQIEENERKMSLALDFQTDVDQKKLCEEEDLLNRQIMELQQVSDVEIDTETDDTETDAEIMCDEVTKRRPASENLGSLAASLEDQYETALAGMSWAERVDTLVVLEALVARDPGRAQQLHAKLSQGIKRRGSLQDALRRLQAKQARAENQRLEYQMERSKRIHQLLARVEEVKVAKNQLTEEKRLRIERRLQKAAENRDQHLKDIVRKAHDEEEKLKEIAFIKQLEAENRRHDFLDQCRSLTTRLRQMRRERLCKLEQKAAREAAVGARRQAIEAARKLHVETLLEKRKERDARVEELKELKKQERDDAAREKAEGVKSRLSALAAAAELEADALRSRIRDKQDASQQRLESHLQAIRERAVTGPRQPTTSESQDQNSNELQEEAERLERERREKEKIKNIKKRARKLKQKLIMTGTEIQDFNDTVIIMGPYVQPIAGKLSKVVNQLNNIVNPLLNQNKDLKNGDSTTTRDIVIDVKNAEKDVATRKKTKKHKKSNGDEANVIIEIGNDNKNDAKSNENPDTKENVDNKSIDQPEKSKKKRRNKVKDGSGSDELDKAKSKASSVCSSVSDMSKNSVKKKADSSIDLQHLERNLNELHIIMEKAQKLSIEKAVPQMLQVLKAVGKVIALAVEREELAIRLNARVLATAIAVLSRAAVGTHVLTSNICVHLVMLLSDLLDMDLKGDARITELARQVCDNVSVGVDAALCATRLRREPPETVAALRARAHMLISYICLSGVVTRSEDAGLVGENVQTLLTVCAALLLPTDLDTGPERAAAVQSLRGALGTGLCGAREQFCVLFARGAGLGERLGECGGFVRAARTTHLLAALAELDHAIVQDSFGEGGWPLEYRAAVSRLLAQHAPSDRDPPRSQALRVSNQRLDHSLSETMVLDLISLIGFVVVNNPTLQETVCDGWSAIKTLCTLPANWLVSPRHSRALLPTLAALAQYPAAEAVISTEMNMQILDEYMNSDEAQDVKLVQIIKQGKQAKRALARKKN